MKRRKSRLRMSMGFADQLLWSGSNFASSILAARIMGIRSFGGYAFAMVIGMIGLGLHRALISDPLLISDSELADEDRVQQAASASLLLGALFSLAVATVGIVLRVAGHMEFSTGCLALSIWVAPMFFQDLGRWVAFQRHDPRKALVNDAICLTVQALGLLLVWGTAIRSLFVIMAAWGGGTLIGALFGVAQHAMKPQMVGFRFLRREWPVSRWLLADFVGYYSVGQLYLFVVSWGVGPDGLGAVRAAQQLLSPVAIVIAAVQSFGLRDMVDAAGRDRRDVQRLTRSFGLATFVFAAVYSLALLALSGQLIQTIYGSDFAAAGALVRLAVLQWLVMAWGVGLGLAIKATKTTRRLLGPRLVGAAAVSFGAVALCKAFGVHGAAGAGFLSAIVTLVVLYSAYRSWLKSTQIAGQHRLAEREPFNEGRSTPPSLAAESSIVQAQS